MLLTQRPGEADIDSQGFCWSCGVGGPDGAACHRCGTPPRPRPVERSSLIGAMGEVRRRMRTRTGLVVSETPSAVLLAFADATVLESPRDQLTHISDPSMHSARSSS